jgi:hypothetical protein
VIDAQRVDFIAVPTKNRERAVRFYEDPDGNGLVIHHRYEPYLDGRSPDEQV